MMIGRTFLIVAYSLQAVFAQGPLVLRPDDPKCKGLGTGGDIATVGLAECDSCATASCLQVVLNTEQTWDQARDYCKKLIELDSNLGSSHLAVVYTEGKLNGIKSFLNGLSDKPRATWIGLHSYSSFDTCSSWDKFKCLFGSTCYCKRWMWLDSVPLEGTPQYWADGQPAGTLGLHGGDCIKMARDHDWRYFDDPCSTSINARKPDSILCEAAVKTK